MRSMKTSAMAAIAFWMQATGLVAGTVDLSATPPDLTPAVAPNIILTYDDSISMLEGFVPGYIGEGEARYGANSGYITDLRSGARICGWFSADGMKGIHPWNFSPAFNTLYYDESQTYAVPKKRDGTDMDPGSFTAAWSDGIAANTGGSRTTRNLSGNYAITWSGGNTPKPDNIYAADASHAASTSCNPASGYMPFPFTDPNGGNPHAFFYRFTGDAGNPYDLLDPSKYVAVDVSRLGADQQKNFAIWYGFYRTRNHAARSSLGLALTSVPKTVRMQWQRLSTGLLSNSSAIRPLSDETQYKALIDFIYASQPSGGTPTRGAMTRVANYFGASNRAAAENNPYFDIGSGKELSCRRNYSLLVTDGGWKDDGGFTGKWADLGAGGSSTPVPANPDQRQATLPDGRRYDPASPSATIYGGGPSQGNLSGFADVAFHYWATDLRPDLPNNVVPYLPDRSTGVTGTLITTAIGSDPRTLPEEVYFNPANDPATWQHLVQFVVAFGLGGQLSFPDDLTALRKGGKTWSDWATSPNNENTDTPAKTDDTWHAAINSRGALFSARSPQQLVDQIKGVINSVVARNGSAAAGAISATVLGGGASYFRTGFSSDDWSGSVQAMGLDESGNLGATLWSAGTLLDARVSGANDRVILTSTASGAGHGAAFMGLGVVDAIHAVDPAFGVGTVANDRLNWIRGERTKEGTQFRQRGSALGAVVNAQAVYLARPISGYRDAFPPRRSQPSVAAPEMAKAPDGRLLHSYEQFVADHLKRAPTLYVAANDGMLHAFDATVEGIASTRIDLPSQPGRERWAYVPHAVYGNLRSMSALAGFQYTPTVDGTPVVRDVFFSEGSQMGWHSLLVAGLRLGGRGVYALDVTDADASEDGNDTARGPAGKVLWEFSHVAGSTEEATVNLGYTFGRPNVGRLSNGEWVVLVPGGYFPDGETDPAASSNASSLFVLDARTGALLRELRTPTSGGGSNIVSYGLTSPVLGDYDGDQIDDVAFAGDLVGNLWRFDLKDENPANWKVDLLFKPAAAGDRPITVMPRLFPEPGTKNLIVVFGTGKYLGSSDNVIDASTKVQAIYGIRDPGVANAAPVIEGRTPMVEQTLYEQGNVRGLTTRAVPATTPAGDRIGGWFVLLNIVDGSGQPTNQGERVVVDATALFDSNRAVITTLIPQKSDPCNPAPQGAVLVVDAATGGAAKGVGFGTVDGWNANFAQAGARITNAPTGGYLPAAVSVGGGQVYLPGVTLASDGSTVSFGDDLWRRRSWRALIDGQ